MNTVAPTYRTRGLVVRIARDGRATLRALTGPFGAPARDDSLRCR